MWLHQRPASEAEVTTVIPYVSGMASVSALPKSWWQQERFGGNEPLRGLLQRRPDTGLESACMAAALPEKRGTRVCARLCL